MGVALSMLGMTMTSALAAEKASPAATPPSPPPGLVDYGVFVMPPNGEPLTYYVKDGAATLVKSEAEALAVAQGDKAAPPPVSAASFNAALAAYPVCYYGIANWYFNLNGNYFDWQTVSDCNIAQSGAVRHSTQIYRSSWSGWRGYHPWEYSGYSSANPRYVSWAKGCGSGGTYDYTPAVRIYAANVGTWSAPIYANSNNIRRTCGTAAAW